MFTFQLENDRRTVETSLFFNVNFYSEISVKKLVKYIIVNIIYYLLLRIILVATPLFFLRYFCDLLQHCYVCI